jgi:hypothetical protein
MDCGVWGPWGASSVNGCFLAQATQSKQVTTQPKYSVRRWVNQMAESVAIVRIYLKIRARDVDNG